MSPDSSFKITDTAHVKVSLIDTGDDKICIKAVGKECE